MTKEDFQDLKMYANVYDNIYIREDLTFEKYETELEELKDSKKIKVGDIVRHEDIFILVTYKDKDDFEGIMIPEGQVLSFKAEGWKIYRRTTHMEDTLKELMKTAKVYADL